MLEIKCEQIQYELKLIEQKYNIKILFAVESGSRAWGFSSKDSDYDIRFVYVHSIPWYLSLEEKKDTIDSNTIPINGGLDFQGWELRKALKLLKKSNPSILEWLNSPIVYISTHFYDKLKELSHQYYNPKSYFYHHINLIKRHKKQYLMGSQVNIKKYFYVIRSCLICKYTTKFNNFPPIEFEKLLDTLVPKNNELRYSINRLLLLKKNYKETKKVPKNKKIDDYIQHICKINIISSAKDAGYKPLNNFFIRVLSYYQKGGK